MYVTSHMFVLYELKMEGEELLYISEYLLPLS